MRAQKIASCHVRKMERIDVQAVCRSNLRVALCLQSACLLGTRVVASSLEACRFLNSILDCAETKQRQLGDPFLSALFSCVRTKWSHVESIFVSRARKGQKGSAVISANFDCYMLLYVAISLIW